MADRDFDVVVGAGFAGMYLLHRLRGMGFSAKVFEAGTDVEERSIGTATRALRPVPRYPVQHARCFHLLRRRFRRLAGCDRRGEHHPLPAPGPGVRLPIQFQHAEIRRHRKVQRCGLPHRPMAEGGRRFFRAECVRSGRASCFCHRLDFPSKYILSCNQ